MQTPQQVIEKIQKLLRLSASPNRHEAELAMARAQELAVKYRIELASVEAGDPSAAPAEAFEKKGVERPATFQQKFVDWIVRKHFNVSMVSSGVKGSKLVWYIGKPTDIAFAQFVYAYLSQEFPRLWTQYQRETKVGQGERVTYFFGLYRGLDEKLTEARRRAEEEGLRGDAGLASRYQLAVVSDAEGMNRALGQFFPNLTKGTPSRVKVQSSGTFGAGHAAGKQINISRPLGGGASGSPRLQ